MSNDLHIDKGSEDLSAIQFICAFNEEELAFFDLEPFFP